MSTAAKSPFLALLGSTGVTSVDKNSVGAHYGDGLSWRSDPGREISRFAAMARDLFGKSSFEELALAASIANESIDPISEELATKWRDEVSRPDVDARWVLSLFGPADLLASARIWQDESLEATECLHKPHADAFDGPRILAAFALLMADHAVDASHRRELDAALSFMAIAGAALRHATMSEAQAVEARRQFEQASARWRAVAASGGDGKKRKLLPTKKLLQDEYRVGRASGKFKSANNAATELQDRAIALSREAGATLAVERAQKTVAKWLREVDSGE